MAEASDQEREQVKKELESQSQNDKARKQQGQAAPSSAAGQLQDYKSEDKQEVAAQKIQYTEVKPEKKQGAKQ